ncbi:patatin-like phospholipase family protein [Mucilaginibacter angelicae]|uniref:Patatin-like phospholipase family protein n=1 Tax=Mucilaginibacter angelicae TaxID=869718 RepID=A0ABV6L4T4_9SPHI
MPDRTYPRIEPEKLRNIALSFSGGGFRAASYALGCLSFLERLSYDEVRLVSLVRFVSSASGGTITAMGYTAGQRRNRDFKTFFREMTEEYLFGELLIDRVFAMLANDAAWKQRHIKSRNLINAFAMVYDEWVFKRETFEVFWKKSLRAIPEVCFNTTEFKNGMLFRFQNKGKFGNNFIQFKAGAEYLKVVQQIKLGDILACSSCFPVGFEPVIFPRDFAHTPVTSGDLANTVSMDDRYWRTVATEKQEWSNLFSLMDGGIDDNQGIDSFLKAEQRLQKENGFGYDLYIACDVSSNYTTGFYHPAVGKQGFFRRRSLKEYLILVFLIFLLCLAGIVTDTLYELCWAALGVCFVVLAAVRVIYKAVQKAEAKAIKKHATEKAMFFRHKRFFFNLGVGYLWEALVTRGKSAAELAAVVFMKKIRRLSYAGLFDMVSMIPARMTPLLKEQGAVQKLKFMREFVLQNALYLLSEKNETQRETDLKSEPWTKRQLTINVAGKKSTAKQFIEPSAGMRHVATLATAMETTLWYDSHHRDCFQPAAIIAAGQFTTCYNLLKYALRFEDPAGEKVWKTFKDELAGHLHTFKNDPYFMYNEDIARSGVLLPLKLDEDNRTILKQG